MERERENQGVGEWGEGEEERGGVGRKEEKRERRWRTGREREKGKGGEEGEERESVGVWGREEGEMEWGRMGDSRGTLGQETLFAFIRHSHYWTNEYTDLKSCTNVSNQTRTINIIMDSNLFAGCDVRET